MLGRKGNGRAVKALPYNERRGDGLIMEEPPDERAKLLVIGVGNRHGGDDALGLAAVEGLRGRTPKHVTLAEHSADGARLMECWQGADAVILIDAASSGAQPGTIRRFDASTAALPSRVVRHSTHAFGAAEAIELARALNRLPSRIIVYGVEGRCFEAGFELSREAQSAIPAVIERVLDDIRMLRGVPNVTRGRGE